MTDSDVVLDTWAWWEVLRASEQGRSIRRRFLGRTDIRAHTSVITIGEITAKLVSMGALPRVDPILGSIRRAGPLHELTADLARAAGVLRADLRKADPSASLADGIVLATARVLGARLVSAAPAFEGQAEFLSDV